MARHDLDSLPQHRHDHRHCPIADRTGQRQYHQSVGHLRKQIPPLYGRIPAHGHPDGTGHLCRYVVPLRAGHRACHRLVALRLLPNRKKHEPDTGHQSLERCHLRQQMDYLRRIGRLRHCGPYRFGNRHRHLRYNPQRVRHFHRHDRTDYSNRLNFDGHQRIDLASTERQRGVTRFRPQKEKRRLALSRLFHIRLIDALGLFGIFTPLVGFGLAVEAQEHDQPDGTYDGNQRDENPPTAATRVVQTAYRYGQARNQYGQTVERADPRTFDQTAENSQHHRHDDVEQDKHPVLLTTNTSFEIGIMLFQASQIPIHKIN